MSNAKEQYVLPSPSELSLAPDTIIERSRQRFKTQVDALERSKTQLEASADAFVAEHLAPLDPGRRKIILESQPEIEIAPISFPGPKGTIDSQWRKGNWNKYFEGIPGRAKRDWNQIRTAPPRIITAKDKPKEGPWQVFTAPYANSTFIDKPMPHSWGGGAQMDILDLSEANRKDGFVCGTNVIISNSAGYKHVGIYTARAGVGVNYRLRENGHVKAVVELEVIASAYEVQGGGFGFTKTVDVQTTNLDLTVDMHGYGKNSYTQLSSVLHSARYCSIHNGGTLWPMRERLYIELEDETFYPKGWTAYVEVGLRVVHVAKTIFTTIAGYQAAQFFVRSIALTSVKGGIRYEDQPPPPVSDPLSKLPPE